MAYPMLKGNQLWRLRTKIGKDALFTSGEALRAEAQAYFEWCDRHPRIRCELVKYKGEYVEAEVPLKQMYSMDGLTQYLGVSGSYFRTMKQDIKDRIAAGRAKPQDPDVLEAVEWVEQVVRAEQIAGAAVGQFNASVVNRLNGLSDTVNINNSQPVVKVTVRDEETATLLGSLSDQLG